MAKKDFYEVLQVPKGADEATLKKSYRKLVRELHPDANPDDPKADERFKEVKEAYDVLTDPQKKALYDRYGMAAFENQTSAASSSGGYSSRPGSGFGGFGGFGSPFDDLFDSFMGGARTSTADRRQMPVKGNDYLYNLTISFEESYAGVRKEIELSRNDICSVCSGSGAAPGTKPETCRTCNGSGVVRTIRQTFLGQMATQSACETCGGTGQVIKTPCRTCGGSGRVKARHRVTVPVPAGVENGIRLRM
ncbi:MAG: J domain-containing protein, partial [Symbiobacteriaceae bacterium]|nr:J domain-containing protein [Symbiobacteriaceae bacterium]